MTRTADTDQRLRWVSSRARLLRLIDRPVVLPCGCRNAYPTCCGVADV